MPLRASLLVGMSLVAAVVPATAQLSEQARQRGAEARVGRSENGPEDQTGRLSMMTPASRAAIMARVRNGDSHDLAQDFFSGMPSFTEAGDPPFQFWMTHTPHGAAHDNPLGVSDEARKVVAYSGDAIAMYTHVGTHIDTLNHFGLHGEVWNGFKASERLGDRGWDVNGADKIPPIIARGVLVDLPPLFGAAGMPADHGVTPDDIRNALKQQKMTLRRGDIVLVRSGQGALFQDAATYKRGAAGLTVDAAIYLAGQGVMVVGMDVMNPELTPSGLADNFLPVHTYLLGEQGIPIIENLDLESLARDKLYEFAFIGTPLKIRGATGSPIRPIALPLHPEK